MIRGVIDFIMNGVMRIYQIFHKPIVVMDKKYDNEITALLRAGDILLYRGNKGDVVNAGICYFTNSPYTHAEIYVGSGWSIGALESGVSLNDSIGVGKENIDIFKYSGKISLLELTAIVQNMFSLLGSSYDLSDIVNFAWPTKRMMLGRSINGAFACSELVDFCYRNIGKPLSGNMPALVSPADIGYSSLLEYQFSSYYGKVYDKSEYINKIDPSVQNGIWNKFAVFIVDYIMKPFSTRDEFYNNLRLMSESVKR